MIYFFIPKFKLGRMVLEKIVSLKVAIRNPLLIFFIGAVVSISCLIVSYLVFETSLGLFSTFLVTIAMTPFMLNLARYEEARQEELLMAGKGYGMMHRYRDILKVYISFFCGMILALSLLYIALPEAVSNTIFQDQITQISLIRGRFDFSGTISKIVLNNIGVLLLSFLFSFLFGAGAVFILAWNASILSTAIGMAATSIGGLKGFPLAVLIFFPHGSLEILAYFIGGIAGGLISVAITRRKSLGFWLVVKDSFKLMVVSLLLLLIAGLIETVAIVG